jgi:hypothetical protein
VFCEIEVADEHWIARRESSLRDVTLVLGELDGECAQMMNALIDHLLTINMLDKSRLVKSPAFQKALRTLTDDILGVYDSTDEASATNVCIRLRESVKALGTVIATDFGLSELPKVGWIQIVTGATAAQFNAGSEYGIEIDSTIDVPSWETATRSALELIALSHDNYTLVQTFVSYIVPLKQREVVQNLSFSSREMPNVIFKNNEVSPLRFGETLVHEADHQFFYALEECHMFWTIEPRFQAAAHFSPWRDDSRPLDGILRGLSAFTRVALYYVGVLRNDFDHFVEVAGPLLMQRIVECMDAASTLTQSEQLSLAGTAYVYELTGALRKAEQSVTIHQDYVKWRFDALTTLATRREKWRLCRLVDPSEITQDYL